MKRSEGFGLLAMFAALVGMSCQKNAVVRERHSENTGDRFSAALECDAASFTNAGLLNRVHVAPKSA